jgi:hypothetical protein
MSLFFAILSFFLPIKVYGQEEETNKQEKILEELMNDPYVKEHLGWKLVIGQHPMYLLIDEDRGTPRVGERVPPWGAPNKEGYVERVKRNLSSLDKIEGLRINYQWSAVELNHMCENFPDVYKELKKHYESGMLNFVDGSYSQAHLQVLSSESNWRQFEYGQEVYKDLFGKNIEVYARQETGLHHQVPQLLEKFGYRFATLPAFHAAVEVVEGPFEFISQMGRFEAQTGDEFLEWVGLDGTAVPTYISIHLGWGDIRERVELQKDLYSSPKIIGVFPDMDEVSKDRFDDYYRLFDWVLLRDALIDRYEAAPPRAKARIHSYWSYIEGTWAEELMRVMRQAEEKALMAEQMVAMAKAAGVETDAGAQIKELWKEILKSQHHDISWNEVTDLRRKSIDRLEGVIEKSEEMMAEISEKLVKEDNDSVSVFNGRARGRSCLVELEKGKALESEYDFQEFDGRSIGFVHVPAGGFKSFKVTQEAIESKKTAVPKTINGKLYSIELSEEGLIKQIQDWGGEEILECGEYLGGEIRARIGKKWVDNRKADVEYYSGPVADIVVRSVMLGDIPLKERYYFYKNVPGIKVELEFDFDGNEVGHMWFDETKINVYYPTNGKKVYHDIPFGYVEGRESRPLFATNWVYCGGLAYVNRGTVKHRVEDGVIANVLAWGSNHFTNRLHWDWVDSDQYDIRLYGKQKIEYHLLPVGEFDGNRIARVAGTAVMPVYVCDGQGEKSFYEMGDSSLKITSVYEKDGQVFARGYQLPTEGSEYKEWEIFNQPILNP